MVEGGASVRKEEPSSALSGTVSYLQEQMGEGPRDYRLLPSFLGWEKVAEGRMRAL
jgi:hypothetical protein